MNELFEKYVTSKIRKTLKMQASNSEQIRKLTDLMIAIKNDRIQIDQQMSLDDALSKY